jgi:fructose-bisphosphate aldolase class I
MSDAEFNSSIAKTIEQIYAASVNKVGAIAAE